MLNPLKKVSNKHLSKVISKQVMKDFKAFLESSKKDGIPQSRNGYYYRNLFTLNGVLKVKIPRTRSGDFSSKILKKFERSNYDFEALIAKLLQAFMSYDEVVKYLKENLQVTIGHSIINKIAKQLKSEKFMFIKTDEHFDNIILDSWEYKISYWEDVHTNTIIKKSVRGIRNKENMVFKTIAKTIYTVTGIDADGFKRLLLFQSVERSKLNDFDYRCFAAVHRGLNNSPSNIYIGKNLTLEPQRLQEYFPESKIQFIQSKAHKLTAELAE
ncbi:transposase [Ureaplasma ceti]|uniref:Mutator family transposase n=1 Tax=Ureaplasma ceti TaxID=3119530 RepID=A0ABP9UCV0_9BACT